MTLRTIQLCDPGTARGLDIEVLSSRRLVTDLLGRSLTDLVGGEQGGRVLVVDGVLNPDDPLVARTLGQATASGRSVLVALCPPGPLLTAQWLEAGASAVLHPDAGIEELGDVVTRLCRAEPVLGVAIREGLLTQLRLHRQAKADRDARFVALTRREREVLIALAMGQSPEEISRTCYVSMNTVRTQIRSVLAKLEVASVVSAVGLAFRCGWISEQP